MNLILKMIYTKDIIYKTSQQCWRKKSETTVNQNTIHNSRHKMEGEKNKNKTLMNTLNSLI